MATIQASFAKGVLGPALWGRVDTQIYQSALRQARNCIVRQFGGISNRNGLYFICPAGNHTYAPWLVPFQYKTDDSYVLIFGDKKLRFIRNDAQIAETALVITGITQANPGVVTSAAHGLSNGQEVAIDNIVGMTRLNGRNFIVAGVTTNTFTLKDQVTGAAIDTTALTAYVSGGTASRIYEVVSPYAIGDMPTVKYSQNKDTMTFTHPSYPIYELTRTGHTAWTFSSPTFAPGEAFPTGITVTVNTAGAVTALYRVTASAPGTSEESLPGLNNASKVITAITRANPAVVTSAAHGFLNGQEIYIDSVVGMTVLNKRRFIVAGVTTNTFQLLAEDSTAYTAYTSGGTANQTFVRVTTSSATWQNTIAWTAVAGAAKYSVYRYNAGVYGFLGDTTDLTFTDSNTIPQADTTPPQAGNPFVNSNYPGASGYHEQRRVFGGSNSAPDTSEYSQVGIMSNFSKSVPGQDDDAITATFVSNQVNRIKAYVDLSDLLVFTSGGEWRVNSGPDSKFTSSTIKQRPQSNYGISDLKPLQIGSIVLYNDASGQHIRNIGYNFSQDTYDGSDLSVLSYHLLEGHTIKAWDFAFSKEQRMYGVRDDGMVVTMTFQKEQEVVGWTPWDTKGKFESCCALRTIVQGKFDGVYFAVKRTVNGQTVRYIEKMFADNVSDVRDQFYVDCGLSYDSPTAITGVAIVGSVATVTSAAHGLSNGTTIDLSDIVWFPTVDEWGTEVQPDQLNGRFLVAGATTNTFTLTDLDGVAINASGWLGYDSGGNFRKPTNSVTQFDHLEGRTDVVALADGKVFKGLTVSQGKLTLPTNVKASRIHAGLSYVATAELLDMELPQGTIAGLIKSIPAVYVSMEASRGFYVGPPATPPSRNPKFTDPKWRTWEDMDDPTDLFTGVRRFELSQVENRSGRLIFQQDNPLPMNILYASPDIEIGDMSDV